MFTEEERCKVGVREKMSDRIDRDVLMCFAHVKRMGGEQLTGRVYESEVEGRNDRGRP